MEQHIVLDNVKNWPQTDRKMNKTVLITGAGSGIGEAMARVFASQGYSLLLTGPEKTSWKRQHKGVVNRVSLLMSFLLTLKIFHP